MKKNYKKLFKDFSRPHSSNNFKQMDSATLQKIKDSQMEKSMNKLKCESKTLEKLSKVFKEKHNVVSISLKYKFNENDERYNIQDEIIRIWVKTIIIPKLSIVKGSENNVHISFKTFLTFPLTSELISELIKKMGSCSIEDSKYVLSCDINFESYCLGGMNSNDWRTDYVADFCLFNRVEYKTELETKLVKCATKSKKLKIDNITFHAINRFELIDDTLKKYLIRK